MVKIVKHNGSIEAFNGEKIRAAIRKAATRVCIEIPEKDENKLISSIRNKVKTQLVDISVNTIHNMVETELDNINQPRVAKSYREYRDSKSIFSAMLDKVYSKKLSLAFVGDRSNANSDSALVTTQKAIVYNELNSELYKKFFLTQKEERAMSDGYIYVHDRGSRLDTINCCVFDMESLLKGGFFMGNLDYVEPKSLDVAFDLVGDVTLNAASSQYGGFTIPQVDKLFAPYAKKSYDLYYAEFMDGAGAVSKLIQDDFADELNQIKDNGKAESDSKVGKALAKLHMLADAYATAKVKREFEQGFQSWEMKFNSVASSRGDYPFTAITFGLGTGKFETMCSSICMKVRKEGQGKPGFKHPVLFPKISFFYDENLHGEGKQLEWLFDEALDCSAKSMYPDFISLTGDGYTSETYQKYGVATSKMGCRAAVSRWFEKGGAKPADENDKCIMDGRFNMGAISLHFSMIGAKAKKEDHDYFTVLDYYLEMVRGIHKRTVEFLSHKKAGINPLGFCQGGFYGGHLDPDQELGMDFLKPMTISFGVIGLNEASVLMTGKPIHEDNSWAISVLKHINEYIDRIKEEDGILYAIYGTPGESLVGTQASQFKKKYGIIKGVSDREYVTNSFHCPVYADITPIQKQDIEYPMFHMVNGGQIAYARMRSKYNFKAFKDLTRRAMKMGFYWGNNQQLDWCEDCGFSFIDSNTCPKCGSEHVTRIERMNGYISYASIRGKTMYSDTKLQEFKERVSM